MTARNIVIGLVLIIALFGIGYMIATRSSSPSLPYTIVEAGERKYTEDTQFYTIEVTYPNKTLLAEQEGAGRAADKKAQKTIEDTVRTTVVEFKEMSSVDNLSQEEKDRITSSGLKYSLTARFHPYSSASFASYQIGIIMDTGGAHPNLLYKTLVFDLEGNTISLNDLFIAQGYLERISQEAQIQVAEQLAERAGMDATSTVVAEGLAPEEKNFENFVVDKNQFRIFIPPYQAAPYAAGAFEVEIPFSKVRDFLKETVQ